MPVPASPEPMVPPVAIDPSTPYPASVPGPPWIPPVPSPPIVPPVAGPPLSLPSHSQPWLQAARLTEARLRAPIIHGNPFPLLVPFVVCIGLLQSRVLRKAGSPEQSLEGGEV